MTPALLIAVPMVLFAGAVTAQMTSSAPTTFPTRPIRLVLPFAPGGSTDTLVRILQPRLMQALGQTIVVDNRPGGANNVATEIVANAAPDGYTLLVASPNFATNKSLYAKLSYDPLRNFVPVTHLGIGPYFMSLHAGVPANTVSELVALAKAKPRSLSYASPGVGSASHLAMELFRMRAGVDMVHVPYKGGGPAGLAVLAGDVQLFLGTFASSIANVKAGKLKAIAITSTKRTSLAPDVPTLHESGFPGFDANTWDCLVAPAGTPKAVVARLNAETVKILRLPEVRELVHKMGYEATGTTPEELDRFLRKEMELWAKVIRSANIRLD
ncbi:MAG TPA: tripartite tricarboxylate transporter substrate binding protein [Burkholderiales bacterium]|nr:tripartite tricarboxylate transporter substrate binding protein [Burkholderiales bacterium]